MAEAAMLATGGFALICKSVHRAGGNVVIRKVTKVPSVVTIIALVVGGVPLLMAAGCSNSTQNQVGQDQGQEVTSEQELMSEGESQEMAADFLRNSPTFRFDGMDNMLRLVSSEGEGKTYRWEFHYEFRCRHAGYGDRSGLILAQVITDHKAQIIVEQGKIIHAVLDGRWDMLRQGIVE